MPAWIGIAQVGNICKRIGKIASSATGNCHLGQQFVVLLKDADICFRIIVLGGNGSKQSGCASADDGDMQSRHGQV